MIELPRGDLRRARHLCTAAHLSLVVDAMVAGNTPATAWTDDPETPRTLLIWDGGHCLYLAGRADRPHAVRDVVDREVLPRVPGFLKIHTTDDALFAGLGLRRRDRVLFRAPGAAPPAGPPPLPPGFRSSEIATGLATLRKLANADAMITEIESCWPTLDAFLHSGFGYAAHTADTIATWCTAEYVSADKCGIGIETTPPHRRRGLATHTAAAFLAHAATRGLTAHWDAWSDNIPSVAVAGRLDLEKIETYSVLAGVIPARGH